ncbi:MAG: glycosyltransferase family 4 protein [Acidimicrobiia bacterium]
MKVGLIAPPWLPVPPVGYGGTESVIDHLARGLQEADVDVVLYTVAESTCPVPKKWSSERADARMGASVPELRHVLSAYADLRSCGVDVIHDHTNAGPLLAAQRGFTTTPVVTTNHGPFNDELVELYRPIAHRVGVIAISYSQARHAKGIPLAGVIHHGIDPRDFEPARTPSDDYLLFLGRMAPEKGAHHAIRIARRTGRRLVIAAKMREPSERQYFEEFVRPELDRDIVFVGEVTGRQKLDLLANASALINPIQWPEPFGMVMIEALACATPVIALAYGAAPEIVINGVNGYVVETPGAMVRALGRLDQIERSRCRATVEDRFSYQRMADDHLRIYEKACGTRAVGRRARALHPATSSPSLAPLARAAGLLGDPPTVRLVSD